MGLPATTHHLLVGARIVVVTHVFRELSSFPYLAKSGRRTTILLP